MSVANDISIRPLGNETKSLVKSGITDDLAMKIVSCVQSQQYAISGLR